MSLPTTLSLELQTHIEKKQRPLEIRLSAVRALKTMSYSEVSRTFKVPKSTLIDWHAKWQYERDLTRKKPTASSRAKLTEEDKQKLIDFVNEYPGATNAQMTAHLEHKIKPRTVSDYLKKLKFTRKQFSDEQETYSSEESKELVRTYCDIIRTIPSNRRVQQQG